MLKQLKTTALGMLLIAGSAQAQLTISSGAVFNIQTGAIVTVQGDILSNADVTGAGKVILKGTANQNVNMNGFAIPNLEMDNAANATLTGNAKITNSLLFTNGKILIGNNTATLAAAATSAGMGAGKFLETNGTGFVRRELSADISASETPVGAGTDYLPVSLTTVGSTYASASIGVQAKGVATSNKHPRTESFLTAYWPINKTGITGGTTTAVGTYVDPTKVTGTEADLNGFYWDGTNWSLVGSNQSAVANTVQATVTTNTGDLYAMNKFLLLDSKVFLQGAFNASTGLMDDKLRTTAVYVSGAAPTGNLLPTTDPYRTATYSAAFPHTNNASIEIATAAAFNDMPAPGDNIVDWVFLELRNTTTPLNGVLQTRAALLQRDGDIVDIDGISPIYFKNVSAGNYSVSVRHRNHIGMVTNMTGGTPFLQALDIVKNPTKLDFSSQLTPANFLGTTNVNYFNNGTVNMLYAGDVNSNKQTKYSGAGNDRALILADVGGVELGTATGYLRSDLNLNRQVKYSGAGNDRAIILTNVLSGVELNTKTQVTIP
jgi:hypothetical protein